MTLHFGHGTGSPTYHPGLGDFTVQTAESIAATGLSTTAGILGAMHAAAVAGFASSGFTLGIGAAVAGAIALAEVLYQAFQGCGQTCVVASQIADHIEPVLQQNVRNYLDAPIHYASMQAAALNNFDFAWAALTKACSNPQLQDAGQRCIGDRAAGACHYHTSPGGWTNGTYTAPGPNDSGSACWNWFVGYRDPIANDPTVVPDPDLTGAPLQGSDGGIVYYGGSGTPASNIPSSGLPMPLLLGGGALLLLLAVSQ